jgi:glutamate dehydrogenase (NADP+)
MPCELAAIKLFEQSRIEKKQAGCYYGPGKAANAGGVAISGVEMSQNAQRLTWTPEEVDQKLKDVMKEAFEACLKDGAEFPADGDSAAKEVPSLVVGANVSGFRKVADAMKAHGDWW